MFFGALPGSALAINENLFAPTAPSSINLFKTSGSDVLSFRSHNSNIPVNDRSSVARMLGCDYFIEFTPANSWSVVGPYKGLGSVFSVSYKTSKSNLNLQDLTFEWAPNPYFGLVRFYNNGSYGYDYSSAFYRVSGSAVVTFSDGSSETIPISVSNGPVSFSAKKDNRTNMFNLTSDNNFTLTSKDTASLSGSLSHSGGTINAPVSGQVSGTAQLPDELTVDIHAGGSASFGSRGATATLRTPNSPGSHNFAVDNTIEIQADPATGMPVGERYFNIWATRLYLSVQNGTIDMRDASIYFGASQAIALTASLVNAKVDSLTVTAAKASAVGTLVAPNSSVDSVVQISRHEPFVTVTGFSVDLTVSFPIQSFDRLLDVNNLSLSYPVGIPPTSSWGSAFYYFDNLSFVWGSSESMLSHIAATLDGIYYTLRFDLPLQLRHLIIPTQEEVEDVVTGAVDEIKNNAGGLGEAVKIVDNEFKEIKDAISSSSATPVIFPAFDINIFGYQVKLWDNIDFAPYLDNELVRLVMAPAELMFIYKLASLLVRHFYLMWVCLTSGSSYFGFLKSLNSSLD